MKLNYINTESIIRYSPNNNEFLSTAFSLLFDEIQKFENSIKQFMHDDDFTVFKKAIHKIKPSIELFHFPEEFKTRLLDFYDLKNDKLNNDVKNDNLSYFSGEIAKIKEEVLSLIQTFSKTMSVPK